MRRKFRLALREQVRRRVRRETAIGRALVFLSFLAVGAAIIFA